jgi:exonuclease III
MRVISLNTNRSAKRMIEDIQNCEPDLILLQEWTDHKKDRTNLAEVFFPGLRVAATRYLATIAEDNFDVVHSEDRMLITRHEGMTVVNTYIPASGSGKVRREHLEYLNELLSNLDIIPDIIAGDFNMAPRLEDGWYGENHSKYTTRGERLALQEIIARYGLNDLGSNVPWEATFERINNGKLTSFRCDLAIVRENLWVLTYEHRFRNEDRMSDHSALILDRGRE